MDVISFARYIRHFLEAQRSSVVSDRRDTDNRKSFSLNDNLSRKVRDNCSWILIIVLCGGHTIRQSNLIYPHIRYIPVLKSTASSVASSRTIKALSLMPRVRQGRLGAKIRRYLVNRVGRNQTLDLPHRYIEITNLDCYC
jgi:hypothetical protein